MIEGLIENWPEKVDNRPAIARKSCDNKVRYRTIIEAQSAANEYRSRVLFTNIEPYWCRDGHKCYHIGHNRFMGTQEVLELTSALKVA